MADRDNPPAAGDLHFQDRAGCLVLVDPVQGDQGAAWAADRPGEWRWRGPSHEAGTPYPTGTREDAMTGLIDDWTSRTADAGARLAAQAARTSFGHLQIVRI